jgi:hypothetical protein
MLLRWPPNYEKLVLEHGDLTAVHVGGKGGLRISGVETRVVRAGEVHDAERQWLRDNGIDWDGQSA